MKKIIFIIIFIPFILYSQIKIAIIDNSFSNKDEFDATLNFFNNNQNIQLKKISFEKFINKNFLDKFSLVWIHRVDSSDFNDLEKNEKFISTLKKYISNGGKLFLSMDGMKYLNLLNLENEVVSSKYVDAIDDGYGRKLGLHSFLTHPIFNELNGGAYIFNPLEDMKIRQLGFFEPNKKLNGKVVAVDWSYITLKENSKLVLEYDYGKGKVLACGAYLIFSIKNQNEKHLKKFIENCFEYLYKTDKVNKKYFWNNFSAEIKKEKNIYNKIKLNKSKEWIIKNENILSRDIATSNYWNVAGERMLLMGKENFGVDEIWSHPFMAIKNYEIGFVEKDSINWLKNFDPKFEVYPNCVVRKYITPEFVLKEIITTSIIKPVSIIHYELKSKLNKKIVLQFQSNLRLMWPYSEDVLGKINFEWNKYLNGFLIHDERKLFTAILGVNNAIDDYEIKIVDDYTKCGNIFFELNNNSNFDVVISASNETANKTIQYYLSAFQNPFKIYSESKKHFDYQLKNYLTLKTPNQDFNEGYNWALIGTKKFIVNTPTIGKSLVAGYSTTAKGWNGGHKINGRPGYAWYFGRDGVWSGFALLDIGDYKSVKSILEMFNKYQDLNGKIFHELTTSGAVHYDASDSTPLYLILCGRYLKESGDVNFIKQNINHIKNAIEFCYSTDTDNDHLIENTNVGHGWVEGGGLFTAHTEVYLAACWAEALKWSGYIFNVLKIKNEAKKYFNEYETVKNTINTKFWNAKNNFTNFSKLKNGSFNEEKTVLSAVPIYFGLIDSTKAKKVLHDFAESYFSSDWGVRILRNDSKIYNPRGYHTGSVWPLFTGWTALAEYKFNNDVQAFSHVMNNLLVYKNWQLGGIEEVLNGDEYKPSGVCPQQCWSQTMVIQPIIEGLLGLSVDAINKLVFIEPQIPEDWNFFEVKNIKVGNKKINIAFRKENDKINFYFYSNSNDKIKLFINYKNQFQEISMKKISSINFPNENNPKVLPHYVLPLPNDSSKSFRILDEKFLNNIYEIEVQGLQNRTDTLKIISLNKKIDKIENASIINKKDNIYNVEARFDNENKKYITKKIKIYFSD